MKEYVVTFLFTPDFKNVWLIEKQKPEWQKGCLNGIGGKIEENELPIQAANRELFEESGVKDLNLVELGEMLGVNNDSSNFRVYIFTGVTTKELKTMESEEIDLYPVKFVRDFKTIENVPTLIEASIYRLTGSSNFKKLLMRY